MPVSRCQADAEIEEQIFRIHVSDFEGRTTDAINDYIGIPVENTNYYAWHKKLWDAMYDYIMDTADDFGDGMLNLNPQTMVHDFERYLQYKRGWPISQAFDGKRSMEGVYKAFMEGVRLKNKKVNKAIKTLISEDYVGFRIDKSGETQKITEAATSMSDRVVAMTMPYREKFLNINIGLRKWIDEIDGQKNSKLNDLLIYSASGFTVDGTKFGMGRKSVNVKLIEIKHDQVKPKQITGLIIEFDDGIKELIGKESEVEELKDWTEVIEIPRGRDSIDYLKDRIVLSGIKSFIDDLGHGQARKVVPKHSSEVSETDIKNIKWMMQVNKMKHEADERSSFMHSKLIGDIEYNYVMIKQGEDSIGESYNLYIVNHINVNTLEKTFYFNPKNEYNYDYEYTKKHADPTILTEIVKDVDGKNKSVPAFREGFYRSKTQESFGRKFDADLNIIEDSNDKAFTNFEYMDTQPSDALASTDITDASYSSIWETLHDKRVIYNDVWNDALKIGISTNRDVVKWFETAKSEMIESIRIERKRGIVTSEAVNINEAAVNRLFVDLKMLGIENKLVYDSRNDTIHSFAITISKLNENYFPMLFSDEVYDGFVRKEISDIQLRIEKSKSDEEIVQLQELLDNFTMTGDFSSKKTMFEKKSIAFKHRVLFTDATLRRDDDEMETNYLSNVFNAIMKNRLIADTVIGITNMSRIYKNKDVPMEQIKYAINTVKSAMSDPSIEAEIFGIDVSPTRISSLLNKISTSAKWTPESAEQFFKSNKAFVSALLLRAPSALTNNFQKANPVIIFGLEIFFEAQKLLNGPDKEAWISRAEFGGAVNSIIAFNDAVMTTTSDLKWNDAGFYLLGIPHVFNLKDYYLMHKMGKEKFLKKGHPVANYLIDSMLEKRIKRARSAKEQRDLEYAKKLRAEIREGYYNLIAPRIGTKITEKYVRDNYRKMVGEVKRNMEKKFVSWTLSWMPPIFKKLESFLTFTGGEFDNRTLTYVMELLVADRFGFLGSDITDDDGSILQDRFKTKEAVFGGRLAIASMQFNMSEVSLGEGFRGLGKNILQYRGFQVFQTRFGRNIRRMFVLTSHSKADMATRLVLAMRDLAAKKATVGTGLDYEALSFARLLLTRTSAAIVSAFLMNSPKLSFMLKNMKGMGFARRFVTSGSRGLESPAWSVMISIMTKFLIYALFSGDDEDEKARKVWEEIARGLLIAAVPVQVSVMASYAYRSGKKLLEDN